MAADNSLFGPSWLPTTPDLSRSLFPQDQRRTPSLTAKQMLEMQAQQEQASWMAEVNAAVEGMLQDPDWVNAPAAIKEQMLKDWEANVWGPWAAVRFAGDRESRKIANELAVRRLQDNLKLETDVIDDSSRVADMATQFGASSYDLFNRVAGAGLRAPKAAQSFLADRSLQTAEERLRAVEGWATTAQVSPEEVQARLAEAQAVVDKRRLAAEQRRQEYRDMNLAVGEEQAENAAFAEGLKMSRPRLAEQQNLIDYNRANEGDGQFMATMRAIGQQRGLLDSASMLGGLFAEQVPVMAPIVAGGVYGGPAGAAGVGAALGYTFDTEEMTERILQTPDAQLTTTPEYQRLAQEHPDWSIDDIRSAMIGQALPGTAARGTAIGAAAGVGGVEAALARTGVSNAILSRLPGGLAGRVVGGAVLGAAEEGGEEWLQNANVNLGVRAATGVDAPITQGGADAFLMGAFFGVPFGALAGAGSEPRQRASTVTEETPAEQRILALPAPEMVPRTTVEGALRQTLSSFEPFMSSSEVDTAVNTIMQGMTDAGGNPATELTVGTVSELLQEARARAEQMMRVRYPDTWAEDLAAIRGEIRAERAAEAQAAENANWADAWAAERAAATEEPILDLTDRVVDARPLREAQQQDLLNIQVEPWPSVPTSNPRISYQQDGSYKHEGYSRTHEFVPTPNGDWQMRRVSDNQLAFSGMTLSELAATRPDFRSLLTELNNARQEVMGTAQQTTPRSPMSSAAGDRAALARQATAAPTTPPPPPAAPTPAAPEYTNRTAQDIQRAFGSEAELQKGFATGTAARLIRERRAAGADDPQIMAEVLADPYYNGLFTPEEVANIMTTREDARPRDWSPPSPNPAPEPGPAQAEETPAQTPEAALTRTQDQVLNDLRAEQTRGILERAPSDETIAPFIDELRRVSSDPSPLPDSAAEVLLATYGFGPEVQQRVSPHMSRAIGRLGEILGITPEQAAGLLHFFQGEVANSEVFGGAVPGYSIFIRRGADVSNEPFFLPHELMHHIQHAMLNDPNSEADLEIMARACGLDPALMHNQDNWSFGEDYLGRPTEFLAHQYELYLDQHTGLGGATINYLNENGWTLSPELAALWDRWFGTTTEVDNATETSGQPDPTPTPAESGGDLGANTNTETVPGDPSPAAPADVTPEVTNEDLGGFTESPAEETAGGGAAPDIQVEAPTEVPVPAAQPSDSGETPADGGAAEGPGAGGEASPGARAAESDAENNQPVVRTRRRAARRNATDGGASGEPAAGERSDGAETNAGTGVERPAENSGEFAAGDERVVTEDNPTDEEIENFGPTDLELSELAEMEADGEFDPDEEVSSLSDNDRTDEQRYMDALRAIPRISNERVLQLFQQIEQAQEMIMEATSGRSPEALRQYALENFTEEDIADILGIVMEKSPDTADVAVAQIMNGDGLRTLGGLYNYVQDAAVEAVNNDFTTEAWTRVWEDYKSEVAQPEDYTDTVWASYLNRRVHSVLVDAMYDANDPFRKALPPGLAAKFEEEASALRRKSIGVVENKLVPFKVNGRDVPNTMDFGKPLSGVTPDDLGRWLVQHGFLDRGAAIMVARSQDQAFIVKRSGNTAQLQYLPSGIQYLPARSYDGGLAIGDQMALTTLVGTDGKRLNLRAGRIADTKSGFYIPAEVANRQVGVVDNTGRETALSREVQRAVTKAARAQTTYERAVEAVGDEADNLTPAQRKRLTDLRDKWQGLQDIADELLEQENAAAEAAYEGGEAQTEALLRDEAGKSIFNGRVFILDTDNSAAMNAEYIMYKKDLNGRTFNDQDAIDIGVNAELQGAAAAFIDQLENPTTADTGVDSGEEAMPEPPSLAEADPIDTTWADLAADINEKIQTPAVSTETPGRTPGVAPTVSSLAQSMLAAELREAQATPGINQGRFAPTRYGNPVREMKRWESLSTWLRESLEDYQAPFRRWAARLANVVTGHDEDIPLLKALSLMPGETMKAKERIVNNLLQPVNRWILRTAQEKGISVDEVRHAAGMAGTIRHVLTEGSARMRQLLVDAVTEAEAMDVDNPRKQLAVLQARAKLKAYDSQQAQGTLYTPNSAEAAALGIQNGNMIRAKMAGGLTDAERRAQWAKLRETFTEEELNTAADLVVQGYRGLLDEQVRAGTLLPEEVQTWAGFRNYVSLATKIKANAIEGDYPANWVLNPSRADYRREGSTTPAADSLSLLWKMADRVASEIGQITFLRELDAFYQDRITQEEARTGQIVRHVGGLMKIPLDVIERNLSGTNYAAVMRARKLHDFPGFIYRQKLRNKDGSISTRAFKFTVAEGDTDAERKYFSQLRKSISVLQRAGTITELATKATRAQGMLYTKYNPLFPPVNGIRDLLERTRNSIGRSFRKANGEILSGSEVARTMAATAFNPQAVADFARGFWGTRGFNPASKFGRLWQEFNDSGANYNFTQALRMMRDANTEQEYLADQKSWRKILKKLDTPFEKLNNLFNAFPAFLQYVGFRENGVGARDAAAYTLDMLNMYKQGRVAPMAQAIMPFFRPTIQGGANLIRTLRRGGKAGVAFTVGEMMVYGFIVQMLRGIAGDDDETGMNRYDALTSADLSRGINIIDGSDGSRFILPVGFGLQQVSWVAANAFDRLNRGIETPGDAAFSIMASGFKNILPGNMPAYPPTENPVTWMYQTFMPSPIAPILEVNVLNKNHFGSEINYGSRAVGERDFESGRNSTPLVWHKWAQAIHSATGGLVDVTPETVRHYANYYLAGPLRGMASWLEHDQINQPMHASTRVALGPLLSALGASTIYSTSMNISQSEYFREKNRLEDLLTSKGVRTTDPGNRGRGGAERKATLIESGMLEAGIDRDTIERYLAIVDAERALNKLDTAFNSEYKRLRLLPEYETELRQAYRDWSEERQSILDEAIRERERRR